MLVNLIKTLNALFHLGAKRSTRDGVPAWQKYIQNSALLGR